MKELLKAPFPYFGGKSFAADLIWSRFGTDCGNYVEPFFGSGAVWNNRPEEYTGWSVVNDLSGNVANFWRAIKSNPDEVAEHACYPVNEVDLHARHLWLVTNAERIAARLMADPDYCEPKAAGWWAWGVCSWIGGGWCAGDGPWHAEPDSEGVAAFTLGDGGGGVKRTLPHLGGGRGVNRKLPHLDGGRGVNRNLPHLGDGGQGERLAWLMGWFAKLQASLIDTRIVCGDWQRIMTVSTMTRNGVACVLLDPPYSLTGAVYEKDSSTVSRDVRNWCEINGDNQKLRIALCGHDTEHNDLEALGWTVETWDKPSGYQGADDRERIWFSPHCLRPINNHDQIVMEL